MDNEEDNEEKYAYVYMTCNKYGRDKFWECTVSGPFYNVKYGSLDGKHGNHQNKTFDSYEEALTEMNKKVRDKTTKGGYVIIDSR